MEYYKFLNLELGTTEKKSLDICMESQTNSPTEVQ